MEKKTSSLARDKCPILLQSKRGIPQWTKSIYIMYTKILSIKGYTLIITSSFENTNFLSNVLNHRFIGEDNLMFEIDCQPAKHVKKLEIKMKLKIYHLRGRKRKQPPKEWIKQTIRHNRQEETTRDYMRTNMSKPSILKLN